MKGLLDFWVIDRKIDGNIGRLTDDLVDEIVDGLDWQDLRWDY